MVEDVRQGRLEVRHPLDQPRSGHGVRPHLLQLVVREWAGLLEHARVDRDLADVVQRAAEPEPLEPPALPAEGQRETFGEGGHAGRMAAKVWIPGLEGGREAGEQ